ncbi:hypothetical protein FDB28_10380 [Clostridium botulinum]|nr:hypothetical protein [Clostridium botulinum]NFN94487.1 hypothetical protein [Clostridium botulinum]NFS96508.1 hypothetical protein [Clostridium botulinum]
MEIVKYIISIIIGGGFVTVAVVYIGKIFIGKIFDGMVETYKHKLSTELEKFKVEQQKLLNEYKIKYSRLHDDRANIIIELYRKLVKLQKEIELFTLNAESINEVMTDDIDENNVIFEIRKDEEVYKNRCSELQEEMFDDFINFVYENTIFFTDDLMKLLNELIKLFCAMKILTGIAKESIEDKRKFSYSVISNSELGIKKIKDVKKEIEKEFRSLLGVE